MQLDWKKISGGLTALLLVAFHLGAAADLRLVDAAQNGDKEAVRSLLRQKADVNAAQPDGATALAWAAHHDDLETSDLLLHAGAKVNAANEYGVTPLWLASTNGSAAMVEKLLKAGADANLALHRTGETPLMTAARTGNATVVKLLLAHGANPNAKESRRGQTALMWAVAQSRPEAVMALIERGADVKVRANSGFTPLMFGARAGNVEIAKSLLAAGANVNESTPEDGNALVVASASGNEQLAMLLLEKGADANAADSYGLTPLHFAVQRGMANLAAVEYTPEVLPSRNMPELAKVLVARGANPNARITKDYTPYSRSPYRHTNPVTVVGATPYFLAAAASDAGMMKLLRVAGADVTLTTKANTTPLMVAAGLGRVQDFLEGEEPLALEAAKVALEHGANINAANAKGETALHAASSMGVDSIVRFLIENGANVNAKDKLGQTPWTMAQAIVPVINNQGSLRIHQSTADLLLKLGATPITTEQLRAGSKAAAAEYQEQ